MTKADFMHQLRRLRSGFRRADEDLTEERAEALYQRFGRADRGAWERAVTALLCNETHPTPGQIESALERFGEYERKAAVNRERKDAKAFFAGETAVYSQDPEYVRLRVAIVGAIGDKNFAPWHVADLLRRVRERFQYAYVADANGTGEIERYEQMGDVWEPWLAKVGRQRPSEEWREGVRAEMAARRGDEDVPPPPDIPVAQLEEAR